MIKKINNYLLTHYPLLWNSRIVWVIAIATLLHLCFFLSGLAEITPANINHHYGVSGIVNTSVITFSVFTSLIVVIAWLFFYLRYNAFKNFYIIDKWHNLKQFFIILLGFIFIIPFFESYYYGAFTGMRNITDKNTLAKEVNISNQALAFIPFNKSNYFILNTCNNVKQYDDNLLIYTDSARPGYNAAEAGIVEKALQQPDAYSYKNYCRNNIIQDLLPGYEPVEVLKAQRDRWLDNRQLDSIVTLLQSFMAILKKYHIQHAFSPQYLAGLPFTDSLHTVTKLLDNNSVTDNMSADGQLTVAGFEYFYPYELAGALNNLADVHTSRAFGSRQTFSLLILGYFILYFSLLLFSYKLYTRKVFLISIVSSIVTAIFMGLMAASGGSNSFPVIYILIWIVFVLISLFVLKSGENKTLAGVFLNLKLYLLPFILLCICLLVNQTYDNLQYGHAFSTDISYEARESYMQAHHPFLYWINNHTELISLLNLIVVVLYTAFVFTRLSKKWQVMPDE